MHNILRRKGNQTMKFSQLIEHNMRNIILENDPQSAGDASPRPFSKNSKLSISLDEKSEM